MENNKDMTQGLTLTHLATGISGEIPLNGKEMQLATDRSESLNESWSLLCDSVYARTGMYIEGNYQVDTIVSAGLSKDFH
jgi:hypothetical protein